MVLSVINNTLYGYAQGALAAGGLAGGLFAGVLAKKLSIHQSGNLLVACAICVFPMGAALLIPSAMMGYIIITICCFVIMLFSTVFSIQMLSFVQTEIPQHLIGKVIAVVLTVSMCAQPLGNALYGVLFEVCSGFEYVVIWFAGIASLLIAAGTKNVFGNLRQTKQD